MARVLILENDAAARRFLEGVLRRDGHQVSGADCWEEATAGEYDIAFVNLEASDGAADLSRRWPLIPIIALTTYAALGRTLEAAGETVVDYLCKPCQPAEVRESVRAALLARRQMRQRWLLTQLERDLAEAVDVLRRVTPFPTPMATDRLADVRRAG